MAELKREGFTVRQLEEVDELISLYKIKEYIH